MNASQLWDEGNRLFGMREFWSAIFHFERILYERPNDARVLANIACCYIEMGMLPEAEQVCADTLAQTPNCPKALTLMGTTLSKGGRYEEALEYYKKAVAINPRQLDALINMCYAQIELNKLSDAVDNGKIAVKLDPESTYAKLNLGGALMRKGEVKESIGVYRDLLVQDPMHSDAHSNVIFAMDLSDDYSLEDRSRERMLWAKQHAEKYYPANLRN